MNSLSNLIARSTAGLAFASAIALCSSLTLDAQQPIGERPRAQIQAELPQMEFRSWRDLWRQVWEQTNDLYTLRPAATVRGAAPCPADLEIGGIVEQTIAAVERRRYGDAAQYLARFQDRLYCLNRQGVRGVEFALAAFVHLALEELPAREQRTAVNGAFNLGLLTFDQLLYTGQSWWLPVMVHHHAAVRRHLAAYPGRELGLWIHHLPSASLVAFSFSPRNVAQDRLTGPLLAAFAQPRRFGDGQCTLLGLVRTGFRCDRSDPLGGGGGGGGGIGGVAGGGMTACMLSAAAAAGHGGAMRCAVAAGGGGRIRPPDHGLSGPIVRGIPDGQCAVGSEGEEMEIPVAPIDRDIPIADLVPDIPIARLVPPTLMEIVRDASRAAALAVLESAAGHREAADTPDGARQRRPAGDSACADRTNAAERVASMYACAGGTTGVRVGVGDPREPVARPGPGQIGGADAPSGLLGCHLQGGGQVRAGVTDGRCSVTTCPQGSATCSCDAPRQGRATPPLGHWMGARELLFFEHGGGLTDPPQPDVRREREMRTPPRTPRPQRPPERELSGSGAICPPAALRE